MGLGREGVDLLLSLLGLGRELVGTLVALVRDDTKGDCQDGEDRSGGRQQVETPAGHGSQRHDVARLRRQLADLSDLGQHSIA